MDIFGGSLLILTFLWVIFLKSTTAICVTASILFGYA